MTKYINNINLVQQLLYGHVIIGRDYFFFIIIIRSHGSSQILLKFYIKWKLIK